MITKIILINIFFYSIPILFMNKPKILKKKVIKIKVLHALKAMNHMGHVTKFLLIFRLHVHEKKYRSEILCN